MFCMKRIFQHFILNIKFIIRFSSSVNSVELNICFSIFSFDTYFLLSTNSVLDHLERKWNPLDVHSNYFISKLETVAIFRVLNFIRVHRNITFISSNTEYHIPIPRQYLGHNRELLSKAKLRWRQCTFYFAWSCLSYCPITRSYLGHQFEYVLSDMKRECSLKPNGLWIRTGLYVRFNIQICLYLDPRIVLDDIWD